MLGPLLLLLFYYCAKENEIYYCVILNFTLYMAGFFVVVYFYTFTLYPIRQTR